MDRAGPGRSEIRTGRAGPGRKIRACPLLKIAELYGTRRSDRVTSIFIRLHWLKIADRIDYKSQSIYLFSLNRFIIIIIIICYYYYY